MKDAIKAVKEGYIAFAEKRANLPPIVILSAEKYGGEVDIKTGYIEDFGLIGTKIVSFFSNNPKIGLPSAIGVIVLMDLKTGVPLAIMDGTYITGVRTGAAGAVAASVLARKNSKIVGVIGAGVQARNQVLGLNEVFALKKVKVYSQTEESRRKYASEISEKLGIEVEAVDHARKAVIGSDIVVTATPSKKAIVMDEWIDKGMHINCIGADEPGKQELDPKIMRRVDKIVVDSLSQCKEMGEIQHALAQGIIKESDVHAEIGEVLAGKKKGRERDDEITLFDATGLAAQDIAAANVVYNLAKKRKIGKTVKFL
jgi:ornithine cyclodeaminase/alanine dehydrogenase